jgi:hypothetical protein
VRDSKSFDRSNSADGREKFCHNPQKEKDGKCIRYFRNTGFQTPSSSKKTAEAGKTQHKADPKQIEAEAITTQDETEVGPKVPAESKLATTKQGAEEIPPDANISFEKSAAKEAEVLIPKAPSEVLDYIIRHASGKKLSEEENFEAKQYARELKYPRGP